MKTNTAYPYFNFGTGLRYLQDVNPGILIRGEGRVLENIDRFFANLRALDLRASTDLRKLHEELRKATEDERLSAERAEALSSAIKSIRTTLEAELLGFEVYVVTPKRIDVKKLLSGVSELFAPGIFDRLPDIARFDFHEAGKCIAYDRPTAAAFHLMRGTEAVLRAFYLRLVHRKRVKQLLWGPLVQDLRVRRKFAGATEYTVLFANLDNIRLSFRNPTQHPDKIYDTQEVQDLWGLSVDVVNRMAKDLPELEIPF